MTSKGESTSHTLAPFKISNLFVKKGSHVDTPCKYEPVLSLEILTSELSCASQVPNHEECDGCDDFIGAWKEDFPILYPPPAVVRTPMTHQSSEDFEKSEHYFEYTMELAEKGGLFDGLWTPHDSVGDEDLIEMAKIVKSIHKSVPSMNSKTLDLTRLRYAAAEHTAARSSARVSFALAEDYNKDLGDFVHKAQNGSYASFWADSGLQFPADDRDKFLQEQIAQLAASARTDGLSRLREHEYEERYCVAHMKFLTVFSLLTEEVNQPINQRFAALSLNFTRARDSIKSNLNRGYGIANDIDVMNFAVEDNVVTRRLKKRLAICIDNVTQLKALNSCVDSDIARMNTELPRTLAEVKQELQKCLSLRLQVLEIYNRFVEGHCLRPGVTDTPEDLDIAFGKLCYDKSCLLQTGDDIQLFEDSMLRDLTTLVEANRCATRLHVELRRDSHKLCQKYKRVNRTIERRRFDFED